MKKHFLVTVFILFVISISLVISQTTADPKSPKEKRGIKRFKLNSQKNYIPGQVLVLFKQETTLTKRKDTARKADAGIIDINGNKNIYLLNLNAGQSITESIKDLRKDSNIIAAEPNYIRKSSYIPNDPQFINQWALNNTGQSINNWVTGTPNADIDAAEAWDIETGDSKHIKVAVIDSGVDQRHPDLNDNILEGYNWAGISQTYFNGGWSLGFDSTNQSYAQSIKGTGQQLSSIGLYLVKNNNPSNLLTVSVRNNLNGPDLASFIITPEEVGSFPREIYKQLSSPVKLLSGNDYYIVVKTENESNSDFYFILDNSSSNQYYIQNPYRDGMEYYWDGSSWINIESDDLSFRTNPNSNPRDDLGHGTHVSGIISAINDNSVGISGVSPGSKIMPLKILDSAGIATSADFINSIYYAADNNADIINISLGGPEYSALEQQAVDYAVNNGVVIFAAAGNSWNSDITYPAGYENIIGVGATDFWDRIARFSTYNSTVDISAPGVLVLSTMPTYPVAFTSYGAALNYEYMSGTSMASPMASGLGALILSKYPSLSPAQVQQKIESTADDKGVPGRDDYFGYGRINAYRALNQ